MSVGTICNREVVITGRESSIFEVAQLMRQYHVGDVVVVEKRMGQNVPLGIITDRDIVVDLVAEGIDLESMEAGDMMGGLLVTMREGDGVWEALQVMRGNGVRRLPVVNTAGGLEGILTVDDLLELLAEELNALSRVPEAQVQREQEIRP